MKKLNHIGRKIFENKKVNATLGELLTLAAVVIGLFSSPASAFDSFQSRTDVLVVKGNIMVKTQALKLKFPVEGGYVSQGYHSYHPAIDIAADLGTPIHPVAKGVVEKVGFDFRGRGRIVIINHGSGFKSLYAHLKRAEVEIGQEVDQTTTIGPIGMTGRTTGPHLHLEFLEDGHYFNPEDFLSREST